MRSIVKRDDTPVRHQLSARLNITRFLPTILLLSLVVGLAGAGEMYMIIDENQVSEELVNQSSDTFETSDEAGSVWWAGDISTGEAGSEEPGYRPSSAYPGERAQIVLSAGCSADPPSGTAPLDVQFQDQSTGNPTAWTWAVDDGRTFYEQNPRVRFEEPGTYTVYLRVSNEAGSDSSGMVIEVSEPQPAEPGQALIPDFMQYVEGNTLPMKVVFKDLSAGRPTRWRWTFGDGNVSDLQHPVHYYAKTGVYPVTLVVGNRNEEKAKKGEVIIAISARPEAYFYTYTMKGREVSDIYYPGDKVYFIDKSSGTPTEWQWDFGDGTKSQEQNPTHTFNTSGFHVVSLQVENYLGSDRIEAYILVNEPRYDTKY